MYSRARILTHPIHPMLIPLPITSFVFGLLSLIVFVAVGDTLWLGMARWMAIAGVVTGLLAALPGLVDWTTIPAEALAKNVVTRHLLLNVSIFVLYFVSWLILGGFRGPAGGSVGVPLVPEIVGTILLVASGWLGWEMVYRHHMAIEPIWPEERDLIERHELRHAAYPDIRTTRGSLVRTVDCHA